MTEEIRPICLYVETCLDKKEGTKDCAKCEHHLSYWTEVMIRDMEKNIIRLEQENKELRRKAFLAEQNAQLSAAAFCEKDNKIIELEQENKELKSQIESQKGLITVGGKQQYEMTMAYDRCKSALEEISGLASPHCTQCSQIITIINEVLE